MHLLHEWLVPGLLALVTSLSLRSGCALIVAMYVSGWSFWLQLVRGKPPAGSPGLGTLDVMSEPWGSLL